ncbi:MAG: L-threonylcarbamoyladenylate synthase [Chitinophagaceae bacterium]
MNTITGIDIDAAAKLLAKGELVSIPTETVYGLAANALNDDAVLKIYEVKQRPQFNPLIVHVASWQQAATYVRNIPPKAQLLAETFWPGPLTLLLEKQNNIPDLVTAGSNRVAIRIPNHPLTLALLQQLDFPVAAPSANPSGYVSPTSAQHVLQNLNGKIPYILDGGECNVGVESTIVGWDEDEEPVIYRLGGITTEAVEKVLNQKVTFSKSISENPDAPGQLKSHDATHTPLHMGVMEELLRQFEDEKIVLINFKDYHPDLPREQQLILAPSGTLEEAAKNLFKILRQADAMHATIVLTEPLPQKGLGAAINDRLERAQFIMK